MVCLLIRDNTGGDKHVFITAIGKLGQHSKSNKLNNPDPWVKATPPSEHILSGCLLLVRVRNVSHMMHAILTLHRNVCVKNFINYLYVLLTFL